MGGKIPPPARTDEGKTRLLGCVTFYNQGDLRKKFSGKEASKTAKGKNYAGEIRKSMNGLGTYKAEYEPAIRILAGMQKQYDMLLKQFEEGGFQYSEQTENGSKKAPIITTLESLRKDILSYMNALGLVPRVAGQMKDVPKKEEKKKSNLAAALEQLGSDSS